MLYPLFADRQTLLRRNPRWEKIRDACLTSPLTCWRTSEHSREEVPVAADVGLPVAVDEGSLAVLRLQLPPIEDILTAFYKWAQPISRDWNRDNGDLPR
jgi:hypothetical protein